MQDNSKNKILRAFMIMMKPIARILLRYNIGYREFAEVVKISMVEVATSEYGIRGRPTNISRVAVMTGLTRKEVRRIRDHLDGSSDSISVKSTPLATIIHHWFADSEFLHTDGSPATLPFAGESGSFTSLVRRFGGDIPPGAMRTELKRVGAVEENEDGGLRVIRRSIKPDTQVDNLCTMLSHSVYANLCNAVHNTDPEVDLNAFGWVQRTVFSSRIRRDDAKRLRRICNDRVDALAESVDDLFMAYEHDSDEDGGATLQPMAITMCYFEETDSAVTSLWSS